MPTPQSLTGGIGFLAFRTCPRDVASAAGYTLHTLKEEENKKDEQGKE
jgi:hypothetical protein